MKTKSPYEVDTSMPYPWLDSGREADMTVFEAAASTLRGGPYAGSPRSVKLSWERVTAAIHAGDTGRYYPSRWFKFKGHHRSAEDHDPR